jgi:hypothetical protein
VRAGGLEIDLGARVVRLDGSPVELTRVELEPYSWRAPARGRGSVLVEHTLDSARGAAAHRRALTFARSPAPRDAASRPSGASGTG